MAKEINVPKEEQTDLVYIPEGIQVENSIKVTSFEVSDENYLQLGCLTNVYREVKEDKKDSSIHYDTINYEFRGSNLLTQGDTPSVPRFVYTEFAAIKESKSGKSPKQLAVYQAEKFAQLYDIYTRLGAHASINDGKGLGSVMPGKGDPNLTPWGNFYESIVNSFNKGAKGNTPIYKQDGKYRLVYFLLTYDNYGNLGFPLGNFIDLYEKDRPTLLRKGGHKYTYTRVRKSAAAADAAARAGGAGGGDISTGRKLPGGF